MRLIDGTPQEIAEYQRLTGEDDAAATAEGDGVDAPVDGFEEASVSEVTLDRSSTLSPEDHVTLMKYIYGRAGKNPLRTALTERFLMHLLREEDISVSFGKSSKTIDSLADYLMIRDAGPQRYGAVAYLRPSNGGMTIRLEQADLERLGEAGNPLIQIRNVAPTDPYKINCPLADEDAFELALKLVRAALEAVRH